jgi:hypothetical protein
MSSPETESQSDLHAAARHLLAEGRKRVGPAPTIEELEAYRQGQLDEGEAERMRELLAHYPDSVELLEALALPEELGPDDPHYLSDDDLAQLELVEPAGPIEKGGRTPRRSGVPVWSPYVAAAASFLIAVLGYSLFGRNPKLPPPKPSQPAEMTLLPGGQRGGAPVEPDRPVAGETDKHDILLTLVFEEWPPEISRYRVEIYRSGASGQKPPDWSGGDLVASGEKGDRLEIFLPRVFLTEKRYEIRLFGQKGDGEVPLAVYYLDL